MGDFADGEAWRRLRPMPAPSIAPARPWPAFPGFTRVSMSAPKPRIVTAPTILIFDSGLGGLTVYREVARARPDARFVYVADDAHFPYGAMNDAQLEAHVTGIIGELIAAHSPDLVVIACNTASTLVLSALRQRYPTPFVGTVPAIKPACAASLTKVVSVLGTQATVSREYTKALIRDYAAACAVTLVGSPRLAHLAESEFAGHPATDEEIVDEIAPCFVQSPQGRTDAVVLACTHYPLLLQRFEKLAPWTVRWIDPAPAIARRVVELIGEAQGMQSTHSRAIFTSGRSFTPALSTQLKAWGLDTALPA